MGTRTADHKGGCRARPPRNQKTEPHPEISVRNNGRYHLEYLPGPLPAGSAITFKYSAITEGAQISSSKSCSGIHLKLALLTTKGFVYIFGSSTVMVTSRVLWSTRI